jgi:formate dehydrogenase beta subunit
VEGSEFVLECDAIIPAVGQICVVDCVLPDAEGVTPWKTLVVNQDTFQSENPQVFGGGDCVTGPSTLIGALAAGKKAAGFIAQYLEQGNCSPGPQDVLEQLVKELGVFDPKEEFPFPGQEDRLEPPTLDPQERVRSFDEVESGPDPIQAQAEAARCLRCYRIAVAALGPAAGKD